MKTNLPLITCDDETTLAPVLNRVQASNSIFLAEAAETAEAALPDMDFLDTLVFRVAKKPKRLLTHVERIYYCYQAQLRGQLYAALVDFLIVLNRRGIPISWRMVTGTKAILSVTQYAILQRYLHEAETGHQLLPGDRYSIFSKGLMGVNNLVAVVEEQQRSDHDLLALARDFIEYSQLAEAQAVLETAIMAQPGRLELYSYCCRFTNQPETQAVLTGYLAN